MQHCEPVKHPRAIVSVAFDRPHFEAVCAAARARGVKLSAFIRDAAVTAATPSATVCGWSASCIVHGLPVCSWTR